MNAAVDPVAARWAGALYGLARRKGALDEVRRDVEALARAVAEPATRAVLFNPRVEPAAKRAQLAPAVERAHPLTRNFVALLFDKGREEVLRGIGAAFHRLSLEEQGVVEGVAESARPLAAAELEAVAAAVGARLGARVRLTQRVVPELVGGVRVTAANRMLDASVQGRLEGLRRRMLEARVPSTHAAS